MEALTVEQLNRKIEVLFDYEKEIAKELKKNNTDITELQAELTKVNNTLYELQQKMNELMQGHVVITKKPVYSDEYIYKVRMQSSINKAAAALGVSKSTVQRACHRYIDKQFEGMEV